MGDSFQYGDIFFLGLIAFFIALRLRAMLGKNAGINPRDIWKQTTREEIQEKILGFPDKGQKKPATEELVPPHLQENIVIANGLKAIKLADLTFSTSEFLAGAKLAFEWAVDAFAKGNKDKLRGLLSEERFQHFTADIDARTSNDTTQETTLVSVLNCDIMEASMLKSRAHITVQFTSEQIHVTRDKDRNIIEGDPSAVSNVIDVWTFERDLTSRDPNWKIVAT
jgi:predicted lipid-binding transport protein (Tim44 family)